MVYAGFCVVCDVRGSNASEWGGWRLRRGRGRRGKEAGAKWEYPHIKRIELGKGPKNTRMEQLGDNDDGKF